MPTVLIVEDDAAVREHVAAAVDWNALGFTDILEASDGEDGLQTALRHAPDLIVTDIHMPRMDGLTMLRKLRSAGVKSAAIILSAYCEFAYARQAMQLGAADYLTKPLQQAELIRAVERICSTGTQADELQRRLPALDAAVTKNKYMIETIAYIAAYHGDPDLTIGRIAEHLHISEGHLSHVFKRESGYTLVEYLAQYRIREAAHLLNDAHKKIYEVAQTVGYHDTAYFSGTFRRYLGQTPSEYQNSH